MLLRQRLRINACVSAIMAVVILVVLTLAAYRFSRAMKISEIADDIMSASFERVALRNDYERTGSERAKAQYLSRHEHVGRLLSNALSTFGDAEDKDTIREMIRNHESIGRIFAAIVANREKDRPAPSHSDHSREIENRLISQLNMRLYKVVIHVNSLQESSRAALSSALRLGGGGVVCVLAILIGAVVMNSWTMDRAITDRVRRLREGASQIGGGDLDHVIDVRGDDELAELSNAFNAMTAKMRDSYRDLEDEIEERRRIEEALSRAHDELELRVQERTKELKDAELSLREINETLEQRVADRTAELQAANAAMLNSRRAALNLMEDALAAQQRAEEASSELRREIAERRRAEEALRESEQSLRRLNEELESLVTHRTRLYSVLARTGEAIVRIREPQPLFEEICRLAVEDGSFRLAWVGLVDPESREVRPVASCGESAYLEGIRIIAADVPEGQGPTGRAIREDRHVMNTDFEEDPRLLPWRDRARRHGIRSSSAFPLHTGGQVIGALTIYSDKPSFFIQEEVSLLITLSEDLSFALESIKAEEQRVAAEEALRRLNEELELRVRRRTAELEDANRELESFVYSVSHDLRAPLRSISGFAKMVMEDYTEKLDAQGRDYLGRICRGSDKMSNLIDALLNLSRISRQEVGKTSVDLSTMAASIVSDLREAHPRREVAVEIRQGISVSADPRLMELVLSNLLGNAWKFTSKTADARIEFGAVQTPSGSGERAVPPAVYYVRDNGVGFDMSYADKMFLPFHRLHSDTEFDGAGIGLSIVERVIRRHGGRVWAEGDSGKGTVVYFTLG